MIVPSLFTFGELRELGTKLNDQERFFLARKQAAARSKYRDTKPLYFDSVARFSPELEIGDVK